MSRALLSVTDKTGIAELGKALAEQGLEILSTGGTAKALREAGLEVTDVSEATGQPEVMDGRVKTLHPAIHGGLLADLDKPEHKQALDDSGWERISLLAVNLYRFEETVKSGADDAAVTEAIDIGGPAMIRAAAKNHRHVAVLTDPVDYSRAAEALQSADVRRELAAKAFRHTAHYDSLISRWMSPDPLGGSTATLGLRRIGEMKYGENPHQRAALFIDPLQSGGVAQAEWSGKDAPSYNNMLDTEAAWELASDLAPGSCAIIKHGNPCGAASLGDLAQSHEVARAADPISAFGGIVALHGICDLSAAQELGKKGHFYHVIAALGFTDDAIQSLRDRGGWGKTVRLVTAKASPNEPYWSIRSLRGGALMQQMGERPDFEWNVATERAPSQEEENALRMAWTCCGHVKSNAITVAAPDRLLGVGAGQMNRVQSVRLALEQAGDAAAGAALASDAFFPFPDSIAAAKEAGIASIIQPGGSKKDGEVIAAANEAGIAMVLTGQRSFLH